MKELWQNWTALRRQASLEQDQLRYLREQTQELTEYMVTYTVKISRKQTRAVVDDALTRIRAIPNITVVNSNTREELSSPEVLTVDIDFKFIPEKNNIQSIKSQLKDIKVEMKSLPHVGSVVIKYNTFARVK